MKATSGRLTGRASMELQLCGFFSSEVLRTPQLPVMIVINDLELSLYLIIVQVSLRRLSIRSTQCFQVSLVQSFLPSPFAFLSKLTLLLGIMKVPAMGIGQAQSRMGS